LTTSVGTCALRNALTSDGAAGVNSPRIGDRKPTDYEAPAGFEPRRGANSLQVYDASMMPRTYLHDPFAVRGNMNAHPSQRTSGLGAGR
jgi:hypothetical protein